MTAQKYPVIDCSDEGMAANAIARAFILYAKTCAMNAENKILEDQGYAMAYDANCYEAAIDELFPELREAKP